MQSEPGTKPKERIRSLDQFRGFTVLAMFGVNFLGGMESVPALYQHNENWFSLADWIMPAFVFLVGMAFRLTWRRRVESMGRKAAVLTYVRRSLALIGVSLIAYGFGAKFPAWEDWNADSVREFIAALLKARIWEVLAIIGASQLVVLSVIGKGAGVRIVVAIGLMAAHLLISESFNVHFVLAQPNWLNEFWGAAGVRAWDGGFFGVLNWAAIALAGTVAMDWLSVLQTASIRRFVTAGVLCMVIGYGLTTLSTYYDVPEGSSIATESVAPNPVFPPVFRQAPSLPTPPFTAVPPPEQRQINYWMMSKRLVSLPFVLFATGFVFVLLAGFVFVCDHGKRSLATFRILGQNALAAYLLHYILLESTKPLVPRDSPAWFALTALLLFLAVIVLIMVVLEKRKLYLRL